MCLIYRCEWFSQDIYFRDLQLPICMTNTGSKWTTVMTGIGRRNGSFEVTKLTPNHYYSIPHSPMVSHHCTCGVYLRPHPLDATAIAITELCTLISFDFLRLVLRRTKPGCLTLVSPSTTSTSSTARCRGPPLGTVHPRNLSIA